MAPSGRGGAVVLQRHVDLEQLVLAVLAAGAVVGGVREARDDVAVEGGAQLAGAATSRRRARGSPSGRGSSGRRRRSSARPGRRRPAPWPAVPNCSAASSTASSTSVSRAASNPSARSARVNCGWRPRRTAISAASSACWRARSSMALLSTEESTAPTATVSSRLIDGEADQQAGAPQPAEKAHASSIGCVPPVLESGRITPPPEGVRCTVPAAAGTASVTAASGHVRAVSSETDRKRPTRAHRRVLGPCSRSRSAATIGS